MTFEYSTTVKRFGFFLFYQFWLRWHPFNFLADSYVHVGKKTVEKMKYRCGLCATTSQRRRSEPARPAVRCLGRTREPVRRPRRRTGSCRRGCVRRTVGRYWRRSRPVSPRSSALTRCSTAASMNQQTSRWTIWISALGLCFTFCIYVLCAASWHN